MLEPREGSLGLVEPFLVLPPAQVSDTPRLVRPAFRADASVATTCSLSRRGVSASRARCLSVQACLTLPIRFLQDGNRAVIRPPSRRPPRFAVVGMLGGGSPLMQDEHRPQLGKRIVRCAPQR